MMTPEEREVQLISGVNDLAQAVKSFGLKVNFNDDFDRQYAWEMLNQAIGKLRHVQHSLPDEEERLKRLSFDP